VNRCIIGLWRHQLMRARARLDAIYRDGVIAEITVRGTKFSTCIAFLIFMGEKLCIIAEELRENCQLKADFGGAKRNLELY